MPIHKFSMTERVRWSDLDPANVVYFGNYVRYVELAEAELARHLGHPFGTVFESLDVWLPRVEYHINFTAPAFHDDLLRIEIWIAHLGESSIRLEFEILRDVDRASLARGHVVVVAVERVTFRPTPIPPPLRRSLEGFRGLPPGD